MSDMEDRLRAALQAKAGQVTDERLLAADQNRAAPDFGSSDISRLEPGIGELRTSRHARWVAPSLAVAAVAAIAVVTTVITTSLNNSAPSPVGPAHSTSVPEPSVSNTPSPTHARVSATPSHTSTPTHTAVAPTMLGNGQQGERTAVPWSLVGTGWTVALWTPDLASSSEPQSLQTAPERLYLVDPLGGRYLITELPANTWQLMDYSGDGHRALLLRYVQPLGSSRLAEVNLQTGALGTEINPGTGLASARYTKPLGMAVVAETSSGLHKLGLDGHQESATAAVTADPLYSPDGLAFLADGNPDLRLYSNAGPLIRTIKAPAATQSCTPVRWSTPTIAVVDCTNASSEDGVWLVPIDGGTPTALAVRPGSSYPNAALFGTELFAQTASPAPCTGAVGTLRGGSFSKLTLPGDTGFAHTAITGVTTSSIRISLTTSCRQTALLSYDPADGSTTVLLGGSLDGGTILGSVLFHATDPKD